MRIRGGVSALVRAGGGAPAPRNMLRACLAAVTASIVLASTSASAQTLGIGGDTFTVDGKPTFIVFVSYFDGVRRIPDDLKSTALLDGDLAAFVSKGIGGIRVFPNWMQPAETLMDESGAIRPLQLEKLKRLIDRAAAKRLIVDVSFARETVKGLSIEQYRAGIRAATTALEGRGNILFDLQNESVLHDLTPPLLKQMRDEVKQRDPSRVVTASSAGGDDPDKAAAALKEIGLDVLAYHDGRDAAGRWASATGSVIAALRSALERAGVPRVPIYLQEPNRFGRDRSYYDNNPEHYLTAVRNAQSAGAAAWTFHTNPFRDLGVKQPWLDLLEPGERRVVDGLTAALSRR